MKVEDFPMPAALLQIGAANGQFHDAFLLFVCYSNNRSCSEVHFATYAAACV